MSRTLPVLVLFALALAGCGGGGDGGGASVTESSGSSLVLTRSDVGSGFTEFDRGELRLADLSPPRQDPNRFGRESGWKARFKRTSTRVASGPLVIDSTADVFRSAGGAGKDFDLYKQYLDQFLPARGERLDEPDLGDEAYAITFRQGFAPNITRYYYVAWRQENVTASVFIQGFEGKTSEDELLALARKEQSRIAAASTG